MRSSSGTSSVSMREAVMFTWEARCPGLGFSLDLCTAWHTMTCIVAAQAQVSRSASPCHVSLTPALGLLCSHQSTTCRTPCRPPLQTSGRTRPLAPMRGGQAQDACPHRRSAAAHMD